MKNKILASILAIFIIITISVSVKAESFSANKSTVNVGDSFSVTISGVNGKVSISSNDKVSISNSGTAFVHGNLTITGTAKSVGTGTVSIKLEDATTTGADAHEISGTRKVNITIKEKETPVVSTPAPAQTQTTKTTTSSKTTNKTTNKKEVTKNATKSTTQEVTPTTEKEEATPEWGISEVKLIGIKENGEKVDLELDKKFDIKTYDYTCNVSSDIKNIEVKKEAYEYNEFVTISGIEEELKAGENIITLKLAKEGQQELVYTVKVNKEEKIEEVVPVNAENIEENEEATGKIVSMPLWVFIIQEIGVIAVASIITFFATRQVNTGGVEFKLPKKTRRNK